MFGNDVCWVCVFVAQTRLSWTWMSGSFCLIDIQPRLQFILSSKRLVGSEVRKFANSKTRVYARWLDNKCQAKELSVVAALIFKKILVYFLHLVMKKYFLLTCFQLLTQLPQPDLPTRHSTLSVVDSSSSSSSHHHHHHHTIIITPSSSHHHHHHHRFFCFGISGAKLQISLSYLFSPLLFFLLWF